MNAVPKLSLYENVKRALRSGQPPEHIAHVYGVSVDIIQKVKQLVELQDKIEIGLKQNHDT